MQNLDGVGKNNSERNNSISEGAGHGGKPNLVSYLDLSQRTKERIPMAGKADIAGGTGKSSARDVSNGQLECTCIGTFEHPCRETNRGNLDPSDRSCLAWPVYDRGARLISGARRTASRG